MTEKSSEPDWSEPGLPGRFVARARRIADLSQRELAAAVGVSHGTIARIEAGKGHTSPTLLSAVLRIAGLRLAVIDEDGREVLPIPADTVRDNAGRRFPAHLDVAPPDGAPRDRFPNAPDRVRVPRRLLPRGGMLAGCSCQCEPAGGGTAHRAG